MRTLIAVLLVLASAGPATAAKTYSADRFDAHIQLLPGGGLDVTETVVFRFEGGPFDHVFREIPTRRTDGLEVLSAAMDGRTLPFGKGTGQVEVRQGSKVRVRWRFAPRSDSTHTFVLRYRVHGVVRQQGEDIFEWQALPGEHAYRIASSSIVIETPSTPIGPPAIETRRVERVSTEVSSGQVQIVAEGIGKNGWVMARLAFAGGTIVTAPPQWQQRQLDAAAGAPRWMMAAGLVFGVGVLLLYGLRQGYEGPPPATEPTAGDGPPDELRPALAGALASNGGITSVHALATLFTMAEHGAITITEEPRSWGQRQFSIHRGSSRSAAHLSPEGQTLLAMTFRHKDREEPSVPLSRARGRIEKRMKEFRSTVREELRSLGLIDPERDRIRRRYLGISIALLILVGLVAMPAAGFARTSGGWSLLVPVAIAAVAVVGFIIYGAMTPLSNEGSRRAEAWRAYQKQLKAIARDESRVPPLPRSRLLPFAVALGLAGAWSRYLKHHPGEVPDWFRALSADEAAFPAFIAAGGAHASGSASSGSGAAGGGGSGAG